MWRATETVGRTEKKSRELLVKKGQSVFPVLYRLYNHC